MQKKLNPVLFCLIALLNISSMLGQNRIDSAFAFQTDPHKKYSLFIPSDYQPAKASKLMLALHPLNTSRWDAKSWCDTLIAFAETNHLILVCPDGGADGMIDDPIDTAFTSALLDSVFLWYHINPDRVYVMGFSWGGRTTYTYGLNHAGKFKGFLPIGAAINGLNEVTPQLIKQAKNKAVYILHGGNDNPGTRFYPVKKAFEDSGAIVNSRLLPGIGHTIDYPNRNQIFTEAFQWLDSVVVSQPNNVLPPIDKGNIKLFPNPAGKQLYYRLLNLETAMIRIYDLSGRLWKQEIMLKSGNLSLDALAPGFYYALIFAAGRYSSIAFTRL